MAGRTVRIAAEAFTPEGFAPFGIVFGAPARPADFANDLSRHWIMPFAAEGGTTLMFSRYAFQPMRFSRLERHFNVTQGFVPLNGAASVMVVAPPTGPDEAPDPGAVRAFLMDGTAGLLMHKGVWHALDRYPLRPPHIDVAFFTATTTQDELIRAAAGGPKPTLTEVVDFRERAGLTFEVTVPADAG